MRTYTMRDRALYNGQNRKIAVTRGESIYDASYHRVGVIRGDELFDSNGRIMMTVRGRDIYDGDNRIVAGLSETQESIEGMNEGMLRSALWYCFVR
ncbi:MAG: 4-fold beta flower protein [Bacteroidota bacterium]